MNRSPRKRPRARSTRVTPRTAVAMDANLSGDPVLRLAEMHRDFLEFVERRVGERAIAEDILQEAFVRATTKAHSLQRDESAVAWFYRILRNAVTDHYRRQGAAGRAHEVLAVHESDGEADPQTWEFVCRCISQLAAALKPEYAEVVQRIDIDGISVSEFASEKGIAAGNAAVRVHRARKSLRQLVEDSCRVCAEHGCFDCDCGPPAT